MEIERIKAFSDGILFCEVVLDEATNFAEIGFDDDFSEGGQKDG